jgi:hypothetical protein
MRHAKCRSRAMFLLLAPLALALMVPAQVVSAQGVTTSAVSGTVTGTQGNPISGASISAVHVPSGTRYGGITRADGRFFIPGMRVGGPYTVTAAYLGFETQTQQDVTLNLGAVTDLQFVLRESAIGIEGITVTTQRDATFSPDRTGASTQVTRETLDVLPTITQRLTDVTRMTPQAVGNSFAGQDGRLNNITVDGSFFNNSFGLGGQPGDRTGVAPISLQAIEQVQVNIAPFDVRQGNFVGASINSVTRSGTNDFRGSVYYQGRERSDNRDWMVGSRAAGQDVTVGTFDFRNVGGWVSGPLIRNRLFFFVNYENDGRTEPGTTFRANRGGETVAGSVTRVRAASLDSLSTFLRSNFGYETGAFEGYDHETPATRFLAKVDFNLNDRNKLSLRYNHLDSSSDILVSASSSLGFGRGSVVSGGRGTNFLNFQNSNYQIVENIRSIVGEWNSIISPTMANNLIVGYTSQDESRRSRGSVFPFVDILDGSTTYTSFGFEPFTPNNELRYGTFQLQNNLSIFRRNHEFTIGVSAERYESENIFFPGSQSAYVYNSLADFYADANAFIAACGTNQANWDSCTRPTSPVQLRRFQVRWANIPGMEKPVQPLEVFFGGIYAQDQWKVNDRLRLTAGVRIEAPFFGETGFQNANADRLTFRDENGMAVQYSTSKLPDPSPLFSPRIGFNWDATGDRSTQLRGGTGIFTGKPLYVWISNQIGNTGVLTGFESTDNTTARPFHPNPDRYKPTNVTGQPALSYELALTDPNFKFPQVWRTNLAVDQRLPFGVIATGEALYNRDVNGIYYINANLPAAQSRFNGADDRPRWVGPSCAATTVAGVRTTNSPCVTRINNQAGNEVQNAVVMKNQNVGYSWNLAGSLERPFASGFLAKVAYSYGESKNTIDPGSIAFGSWNNNQHAGDPNNPGLGFANASPGHRMFGALSYRREFFGFGATTLTLFGERRTIGNTSYVFSGDVNGDGGTSNDLIYVHRDVSEMNFQPYTQSASGTVPARTFSAAEQAAAWNAFIDQDPYLSRMRGQYTERGAVFLPMFTRLDLSIAQEVFRNVAGRRNGLQLRADIRNFGNLLNEDWGVSQRLVSNSPLIVPTAAQGGAADAQGRMQYRMRSVIRDGQHQLLTDSFEKTSSIFDVYEVQLSVRYTFN